MAKNKVMSAVEAAVLLGVAEREVVAVFDSPAGPVIDTFDGRHYIIVDGEIMALEPVGGYLGPLRIFVNADEPVRAVEAQ